MILDMKNKTSGVILSEDSFNPMRGMTLDPDNMSRPDEIYDVQDIWPRQTEIFYYLAKIRLRLSIRGLRRNSTV